MGQGKRPQKPEAPATAFRQPVRVRIVAACTEEDVCPADFAERENMSKAKASRYFKELADEGYLWVTDKEPNRGSTRYYYATIRRAVIADVEFSTLIPSVQHGFTEATLRDLLQRYGKAWRGGTLERRGVDLFYNELCRLDLKSWSQVMQLFEAFLQRLLDLEAKAKVRSRREETPLSQSTVALAGFVSPPGNHPQDGPAVFFDFFRRSYVAFMSGWLDARADSHLTWVPVELDEQGWAELADDSHELRARLAEIKVEATKLLREGDRRGIPTNIGFAFFESPPKKNIRDPKPDRLMPLQR